MKQFITPWSDIPRWIQGLILGGLTYLIIVILSFGVNAITFVAPDWQLMVLLPLLWPLGMPNGMVLYFFVWCLMGAVFVRFFGDRKGIVVTIFVIYGVSAGLVLYALVTHLSFGF